MGIEKCKACGQDGPIYGCVNIGCPYPVDDPNSKPEHRFVVSRAYDVMNVELDGHLIATLNHDEDGYQGMQRVTDVVEEIAKAIGAEFSEI